MYKFEACVETLTVILVLVYPAVAFFRLDHEFIVAKPGVNKSIDKSTSKIRSR